MSEDATLDVFGGEEGEHVDGDSEDGAGDGTADDETAEAMAPPTLTYTSSPDGDECAACGETVQNRWRAGEGAEDPDALVCPACKSW
jgi:hypothetical protein